MNYDEILKKILRRYGALTANTRQMQVIEQKLARQAATYTDANKYAQEIGKILTGVLREYLPDALTDGMLYRAVAEILVQQPMLTAGKDIARVATLIQRELNNNAGIGLNAIVPEMNHEQITGIITGICNVESFENNAEQFFDQISNCMEGYVDDFVRENAAFQAGAGLTVTVQRIADGRCCEWCRSLAGTYAYADVRDKGNDVWRRHNNCHCQIIYDPTGSKRRA